MQELLPTVDHFDLAVLGGGFSGLQVALHALREPGITRLAWVGSDPAFGRGVAYATRDPEHVFNVPLGRMSAFAEDPDHLFRWLEANRADVTRAGLPEFTRDTFLPRWIYGAYLSAVLDQAERAPGAAGRLERFLGRAVDLEELPGGAGGPPPFCSEPRAGREGRRDRDAVFVQAASGSGSIRVRGTWQAFATA